MKRELRYGAKVEQFLNEITSVKGDIESSEFEIYGEDEAGRETCTYIDITELAADAAQVIRNLSDQLQAAEHLAELRGRQNLDTQKKLDALASESAALSEIIQRLIGQYTAAGYHAVQNSLNPAQSLLYDAMQVLKQPATDAYLNSVRADAVASFAHHQRVIADATPEHGCQRGRRFAAGLAEDFAAQLRAGDPS